MGNVDLNLLRLLDALLSEGSVQGAAHRLGLTSSATSHALTRLRAAVGDPLLVRAGRGLVPTPRAAELRERVHALSRDVLDVLRPHASDLDIASLELTFTVRADEGLLEGLVAPVAAAIADVAPHIRLHFLSNTEEDARPLREARIDLEMGSRRYSAPEIRTEALFRDVLIGVARQGHPLLTAMDLTPERYTCCNHIAVSQEGDFTGRVDEALNALGLRRTISVIVPDYRHALRLASRSDLVAAVPLSCLGSRLADDRGSAAGLRSFTLPVPTPERMISAMWHSRVDADPAHRWMRDTVISVCRTAYSIDEGMTIDQS